MINDTLDPMSFFVSFVLTQPDERLHRVSTFSRAGSRSRHLFGASVALSYNGLLRDFKAAQLTPTSVGAIESMGPAPGANLPHGGNSSELLVQDNQFVHKGDLLYVIDKGDYKVALDLAKADVASKAADLEVKRNENERRRKLTDLAASVEEKQIYEGSYSVAQAAYQTSLANLKQAQLNMQRTEVRSTVNGFVTNLLLRVGDYANRGSPNIAIVDSDSYWVAGYFEETKLGSFQVGDAAEVEFMGFEEKLAGHVESITRGISAPNATVSTQGLPSVEAVYTWVRLAQRIPVRIKNRQGAADDNAGRWLDSDRDCHSLRSPHADGLVRDTKPLEPYKRIVSPRLAPSKRDQIFAE
jgi:multidrug efflux pump subunit AcrA (membrane-fusion protein)